MKYCFTCLISLLIGTVVLGQSTAKPQTGYTYKVEPGIPGKRVYISGQRPFNTNGDLIGAGNLSVQTQQVFDNLKTALLAVGMTLDDVTQITYLLKGNTRFVNPQNAQVATSVGASYFSRGVVPKISDTKSIDQIARDDVLIEVEVIAVK